MPLNPKVDERLAQQLTSAEATDEPVQAWVRLKSAQDSRQPAASPEEVKELAHHVVRRVADQTGLQADSVNVQPNLGTLTVLARPGFVKALLEQPEVDAGGATDVPEFGLIRPVDSKPVDVTKVRSHRQMKSERRGR